MGAGTSNPNPALADRTSDPMPAIPRSFTVSSRRATFCIAAIAAAGVTLVGAYMPLATASATEPIETVGTSTAPALPDPPAPEATPATIANMSPEANGSTITVTTSDELTAALEAVQPGQTIA